MTIVDLDGDEHEGQAVLRSRTERVRAGDQVLEGLTSWSGEISANVDWFQLQSHGEAVTIRTEDGREGQVLITRFSVGSGESPAQVTGTGPPPF